MTRLADWEAITDVNDRVVALMVDSIGEFDYQLVNAGEAGMAPPSYILRRQMEKRWGIRSSGFLGTWRASIIGESDFSDDWSLAGSWTFSTTSDAWDSGPYGSGTVDYNAVMLGNAAADIATFTIPSWWTHDVDSVKLYVIDGASSANFSYSVDGGSYTNVSHTWNQNNSFDEIELAVSPTSTIAVRGANAAGSAVNVYLCGISLERAVDGAVLHDLSASGETLANATDTSVASSGDRLAWVDVLQPKLVICGYTNDIVSYNGANYQSNLEQVVTRVEAAGGKVVPFVYWGQNRPTDTTFRTDQLSRCNTVAAANDVPCLDLFTPVGDYVAAAAAGLAAADNIHPSDAGQRKIGLHNWWPLIARGT